MISASSIVLRPGFKSAFLDGLPSADLATIVAAARERKCHKGQILYQADDPAKTVFLLVTGRAQGYVVTDQGERLLLGWFVPGDMLGLNALVLKASLYLVYSEMAKDGYVLVWDRDTILELVQRFRPLLTNALGIAAGYVAQALAMQVSLTTQNAEKKLSQVLLDLSGSIGQIVPRGVEIEISNEDLAGMARVNFSTASRLLNEWQRKGLLTKSRGKIVLRSPELLLRDD